MKLGLLIATLILYPMLCHADANEDAEKAAWIAEQEINNQATLKKVSPKWADGCLSATTPYIAKNRKIKDGLTPKFNAQQTCALLTDNPKVQSNLKTAKNLKFQGCIDGIGMAMEMFDKTATNEKRKKILAEYCM